MSDGLVQRFPTSGETEAIVDFFKKYWGENHILSRRPDFMAWQFSNERNPLVDTDGISAITVWEDSQLVGMMGMIYIDFMVCGQKMPGLWLGNLMSAPDYKNKGVGLRLMMSVHDIGANFVAASGINTRLYPFYKKIRYQTIDRLPRFAKILDKSQLENLVGTDIPLAITAKAAAIDQGYIIIEVKELDAAWDRFFMNEIAPGYIGAARDSSYMNWRYAHHPIFEYKTIIAKNNKDDIRGAMVLRMETVRDRQEKICRVLEVISTDESAAFSLLRYAEKIACSDQACLIDFYCSGFQHKKALSDLGWMAQPEALKSIPCLFQPLSPRPRDVNIALRMLNTRKIIDLTQDAYIVRSDGDQDRPN